MSSRTCPFFVSILGYLLLSLSFPLSPCLDNNPVPSTFSSFGSKRCCVAIIFLLPCRLAHSPVHAHLWCCWCNLFAPQSYPIRLIARLSHFNVLHQHLSFSSLRLIWLLAFLHLSLSFSSYRSDCDSLFGDRFFFLAVCSQAGPLLRCRRKLRHRLRNLAPAQFASNASTSQKETTGTSKGGNRKIPMK